MDEERKQSDGAIYTNNYKKSATQPDWTGKITLDRDLLKDLVKRVQDGEEADIRVALWDRTSKNGNEYKYARLDLPMKQETKVETKVEPTPEPEKKEISDDDVPF